MPFLSIPDTEPLPLSWKDVQRSITKQARNLAVSPILSFTLAVLSPTAGVDQRHISITPIVVRDSPSDANFETVLERVESLVQDAEDEDSGVVAPTEYALAETRRLLRAANAKMRNSIFPRGAVSTGDDGAISIYWMKQGYSVQLTVPSSSERPSYLYYREPTTSDLQKGVTGDSLAYRLEWFTVA